jgi:putative transposase
MGSQVLVPLQAVQKGRRLVAIDETVLKVNGQICYLWAAIDVDTNAILAVYASRGRGIPNAIKFLRKVLDSCEGKPFIDRGPWYRWALDRLGITYLHETFGNRNRIERWFREMIDRTKKFYNNINGWSIKSIEDYAAATAIIRNILTIIKTQGGVLLG